MAATSIEWTDATWNPVAGCTVLSPGCAHCYAMRMAARLDAMGQAKYRALTRRSGGRYLWSGTVRCDETSLSIPLQWRTPRFVFVNSMSDLFHAEVPESFIRKVWKTMGAAPWHTFQVLTKRCRAPAGRRGGRKRSRGKRLTSSTPEADLLRHYTPERRGPAEHRGPAAPPQQARLRAAAVRPPLPGPSVGPGRVRSPVGRGLHRTPAPPGGEELGGDYAVRAETRHEHLAELRRLYGFRSFSGGAARELVERLREEAPQAQSHSGRRRLAAELVRRAASTTGRADGRRRAPPGWEVAGPPFQRPQFVVAGRDCLPAPLLFVFSGH